MTDAAGVPDVAVVIPAAGAGERLGGERKQFRQLGDAPLLVQTLRAFERHPSVALIVVVTRPEDASRVRTMIDASDVDKPVRVVEGGDTRQESVSRGLQAAPDHPVVLIHDAVRPFVTRREISDVIAMARAHGAAAVASPVVDTLRHSADGLFSETVSREGLSRMQTPQGFARPVIVAAHEAAARTGLQATDDVELAQKAGHDVFLVSGSSMNFKITTPEEWTHAELLWGTWSAEKS